MKNTTKDNLIYLAVGISIAAGFVLYAFYTERTTGRIQRIPGPILWGIFSTPAVVAVILERFWEYRHRLSLWLIALLAASVNVSVITVAYSFRWNPPVIIWSAATALWLTLFLIVGKRFIANN